MSACLMNSKKSGSICHRKNKWEQKKKSIPAISVDFQRMKTVFTSFYRPHRRPHSQYKHIASMEEVYFFCTEESFPCIWNDVLFVWKALAVLWLRTSEKWHLCWPRFLLAKLIWFALDVTHFLYDFLFLF